MRAEAIAKQDQPGHAVIRVYDIDAPPQGLTLCFQRNHPSEKYLSETGWQKSEAWLAPIDSHRLADGIAFLVGPVVGDRVAGLTVRMQIKEPGIGVLGATVVPFPRMLTSGAADPSRTLDEDRAGRTALDPAPPAAKLAPEPAAPPPVPPPFVPPVAEPPPAAELPPTAIEHRSVLSSTRNAPQDRRIWLAVGAIALLLAAGGGWHWWSNRAPAVAEVAPPAPPAPPQPPAPQPEKPIRVQVDEFLKGAPAPPAIDAKAREFFQAGKLEGAFLLWRHGAEAGDAKAAVELAAFYDPANPHPNTPFPLNGETAALWYERAAQAGSVDAMRRLGQLHAKGDSFLPADAAKARLWLQRAADKGDEAAKKALAEIK